MCSPQELLRFFALVFVATAQCFTLRSPHFLQCSYFAGGGPGQGCVRGCESSTSTRPSTCHTSRILRQPCLCMCDSGGGEGNGRVLRSAGQARQSVSMSSSRSTQSVSTALAPPPPPVALDRLPACVAYIFDEETSTHVYIVGTSHISQLSARDVTEVCDAFNLSPPSAPLITHHLRTSLPHQNIPAPVTSTSTSSVSLGSVIHSEQRPT